MRPSVIDPASKVRLAVLGAGRVTREVHLPVLSRLHGVSVDVIADPDETSRRLAAARFPQARLGSDWTEALESPCDAVLVALPSAFHEAAACAALQQGKHVYLEKPPAFDHAGALRVAAAARASDVVCHVGFHLRFDPRLAAMRARWQSGTLGRLLLVRAFFATPGSEVPAWKKSPHGGGALLDLATHYFDALRFLLGESLHVVDASIPDRPFPGASVRARLQVAGDAVAEVYCTLDGPAAQTMLLVGTEGMIELDRYRDWVPRHRGARVPPGTTHLLRQAASVPAALRYATSKIGAPWGDPAYLAAWRAFLARVADHLAGRPPAACPAATAVDGAACMQLADQTRQLAEAAP